MNEQADEEANIGDGKQERNVDSTNDMREWQSLAKKTVEKDRVDIRRDTQVDATQQVTRIQEHQYPRQAADEEEMVFMHAAVEDEVGHVSEHRINDQSLERFLLSRKSDQNLTADDCFQRQLHREIEVRRYQRTATVYHNLPVSLELISRIIELNVEEDSQEKGWRAD